MKTTNDKATDTKAISPREIVMGCMSYRGAAKDMITSRQWGEAYMLCDGFGDTMTVKIANDQCWDWSHVRDSGEAAILKASNYLVDALVRNGKIFDAFAAIWSANNN